MNQEEIFKEFEAKLKSGELHSCTLPELNKYLESLSVFEGSLTNKYPERAAQIQTLNSLISVKTLNNVAKTIKHTESTITKLDEKNSLLTKIIVFLAVCSFIATCVQIYFIVWPKPLSIVLHSQQQDQNQQKAIQTLSNPSIVSTSKPQSLEPKKQSKTLQKTNNQETFEKESYRQPKSPK